MYYHFLSPSSAKDFSYAQSVRDFSHPSFTLHLIFSLADDSYLVVHFLQLSELTLAQILFLEFPFLPLITCCNFSSLNLTLTLLLNQPQSHQSTIVFSHSSCLLRLTLILIRIQVLTQSQITTSLIIFHSIECGFRSINNSKFTLLNQIRR